MKIATIIVLAPLAVAACTADTFTPPDAASDGGPSLDASADGGADDAGLSGDVVATDSGSDFSCSTTLPGTVLCDDFDTPNETSPKQKWSGELVVYGTNTFDSTVFHSAPHSYLAQTQTADAASFTNAGLLVQSLAPLPAASATFSARVFARIHAIDNNLQVPILKISYNAANGGSVWAALVVSNGAINLLAEADGQTITSFDPLSPLSFDTWTLLQLDLAPGKISASVDVLATKTVQVTLATPAASPIPTAYLGVLEGSTEFANAINFDDFMFRIQ